MKLGTSGAHVYQTTYKHNGNQQQDMSSIPLYISYLTELKAHLLHHSFFGSPGWPFTDSGSEDQTIRLCVLIVSSLYCFHIE